MSIEQMTKAGVIERLAEFMGWKTHDWEPEGWFDGIYFKPRRNWQPTTNWNHTMQVVQRARKLGYTLRFDIIGEGYDETQHQVSVFTRDIGKRPKELKCEHCSVHPCAVAKSEDLEIAVVEAIIKAIDAK